VLDRLQPRVERIERGSQRGVRAAGVTIAVTEAREDPLGDAAVPRERVQHALDSGLRALARHRLMSELRIDRPAVCFHHREDALDCPPARERFRDEPIQPMAVLGELQERDLAGPAFLGLRAGLSRSCRRRPPAEHRPAPATRRGDARISGLWRNAHPG
jgi:hypothetical protein